MGVSICQQVQTLGLSLQHRHTDIAGLSDGWSTQVLLNGVRIPSWVGLSKDTDYTWGIFLLIDSQVCFKCWLTWLLSMVTGSAHPSGHGSPRVLAWLPLGCSEAAFIISTLTLPSTPLHELSPLWANHPPPRFWTLFLSSSLIYPTKPGDPYPVSL